MKIVGTNTVDRDKITVDYHSFESFFNFYFFIDISIKKQKKHNINTHSINNSKSSTK